MRLRASLLILPLLVAWSERPAPGAQVGIVNTHARVAADSIPVTVRWNRLVPRFVDKASASRRAARRAAAGDSAALRRLAQTPPLILFRVYSVLSLAQYAAATSDPGDGAVSRDAAVAAASAAVLTELFTDSAVQTSIARELATDLERTRSGSRGVERTLAGRRVGEDVARRVIAWAPSVDFAEVWKGTVPKGPGMWRSAPGVPPMGTSLAQSRPWMLDSVNQFRPAPPPPYGSADFNASLDEVRRVARDLSPDQAKLARRWGLADPWAIWNEAAASALLRHRIGEVDAARVLAVLNIAATDAVIACFEAKYHYWTIRPSQADTTITLPDSVGLPNFPSFPSGHACSAGAFDAVLGHYVPQERAQFTRMAEEQAMSRLYGGIHFRFDNEVGLALGRRVGQYAVERERHGGLSAWRVARAAGKR